METKKSNDQRSLTIRRVYNNGNEWQKNWKRDWTRRNTRSVSMLHPVYTMRLTTYDIMGALPPGCRG